MVSPSLLSFITRHLRSDLVDDVYQETQLALATKIDRCRAQTDDAVWAWCYRLARNKIADQWRRDRRNAALSLDLEEVRRAAETSAEEESISPTERLDLDYALALLRAAKPPCVDLLWERLGLDLSLKEVAAIYGLSADAARMQVNRCLELAQKLVAQAQPKATHE